MMQRIVTGDNATGESVVMLDGGPLVFGGNRELGGLFEIWRAGPAGRSTRAIMPT